MPLENGAIFAGYTVRRLLGSGGMGDVYLVDHPRLPRLDAMKVLKESATANEEFRTRFEREANIAAGLWHPHIVGLHDRGEFEGRLWITMDYVDGTDAAQLLKKQYPNGMPLELVAAIVKAVGSALDYAHQRGLLHRDIKPANILLSDVDGDDRRILLSDFGIARQMGEVTGLTSANLAIGTVSYSAPEQLMGGEVDGRADQYALAATAYRLLTGQTPYQDTNQVAVISQHLSAPPPRLSELRPWLRPLDDVLIKAMAKTSDERFDTCSQFARAFGRQAETVTESPMPATQVPAAPVVPPRATPVVPPAPVMPPARVVPPASVPPPVRLLPPAPVVPPAPVIPPARVVPPVSVVPPREVAPAPDVPSELDESPSGHMVSGPEVSAPSAINPKPAAPEIDSPSEPSATSEPSAPSAPSTPSAPSFRPVSTPPVQPPNRLPPRTVPPVPERGSPTVVLPAIPTDSPATRSGYPHSAPPQVPSLAQSRPFMGAPGPGGTDTGSAYPSLFPSSADFGRPARGTATGNKAPMVAIIGGAVVVVVAVVVAGILLTGNDDKSTPGTQTSASAKPSASPTANKTSPVLVGTPGNYQTIATYLKSNNIVETPVHRGDPGTPGVILPMPAGWVDAGNQTPQFAYQSIIYTGPAAGNYRPSATALIFRLGPNAEADKIIDFAAGELYNLSGFSPTDAGSTTTFAGHQAFQVAGTWNLNGIAKMIVQRTVIIQDPTGLYVMQINIDGLADQSDIITRITEAIDRDTKITEG